MDRISARRDQAAAGPMDLIGREPEIQQLRLLVSRINFLSPRTVSTHLYQVFPKLGITSRAALRDALADTPAE